MKRRFALLAIALCVSACLNDYDQFDFGPMKQTGNYDATQPAPRPRDGSAARADVSQDADDGSEEAGDLVDAGATDDAIDAERDDAPSKTDAEGDLDAGADAPAPDDADGGLAPDGEGTDDGGVTGDDGGSDSGPELDGSTDDVSQPDGGGSVPEDGSLDEGVGSEADAAMECGEGQKRCGGECVLLDSPATGCGSTSCSPCDLPHAVARCGAHGECAVRLCAAGFDDCDQVPGNGCETSLASDVNHCGTCGRTCSDLHTLSRDCAGGLCVSACEMGYANCNRPEKDADDGCERAVSAEDANCGGCGNDCRAQGGGLVCGIVPNQCGCAGSDSCRTAGSTGSCEAATGLCKCGPTLCHPGETCVAEQGPDACSCNGAASCGDGETCCQTPSGCRNLQSDPENCGACGRQCPKGLFCIEGACACAASSHCDGGSPGSCVSGQCSCGGVVCPAGQRCQAGGHCG